MEQLALNHVKTVHTKSQTLTVDPPSDIDIEECEDENDSAEYRGNDALESRDPGGNCRRLLLDGEGRVGLGAVVGAGLGRGRWLW